MELNDIECVFVDTAGGIWGAQRFDHGEPEDWFRLDEKATREDAIAKATAKWPGLQLLVEGPCDFCNGAGHVEDDPEEPCEYCEGEKVLCAPLEG
jgi:hypothetical protein